MEKLKNPSLSPSVGKDVPPPTSSSDGGNKDTTTDNNVPGQTSSSSNINAETDSKYEALIDELQVKTNDFMKAICDTKTAVTKAGKIQVKPLSTDAYQEVDAFIGSIDNVLKFYETEDQQLRDVNKHLLNESSVIVNDKKEMQETIDRMVESSTTMAKDFEEKVKVMEENLKQMKAVEAEMQAKCDLMEQKEQEIKKQAEQIERKANTADYKLGTMIIEDEVLSYKTSKDLYNPFLVFGASSQSPQKGVISIGQLDTIMMKLFDNNDNPNKVGWIKSWYSDNYAKTEDPFSTHIFPMKSDPNIVLCPIYKLYDNGCKHYTLGVFIKDKQEAYFLDSCHKSLTNIYDHYKREFEALWNISFTQIDEETCNSMINKQGHDDTCGIHVLLKVEQLFFTQKASIIKHLNINDEKKRLLGVLNQKLAFKWPKKDVY